MNICTQRNFFCIACILILFFISLSLSSAQAGTTVVPGENTVGHYNNLNNYSTTADTSLHPGADTSGKIVPEKDSSIKKEATKTYTWVQQMPRYPGATNGQASMDSIVQYLYRNIRYPARALDAGQQGTVHVQFVVGTDGSLTNIKVVNKDYIAESLKQEAIRVIKAMPKWIPSMRNGKPVAVRFSLPVKFVL